MYEKVCYNTNQLVHLKNHSISIIKTNESFSCYNNKSKRSKKETIHINVFWSVGVTDVLYIRITRLSSVLGGYIQERFFSI